MNVAAAPNSEKNVPETHLLYFWLWDWGRTCKYCDILKSPEILTSPFMLARLSKFQCEMWNIQHWKELVTDGFKHSFDRPKLQLVLHQHCKNRFHVKRHKCTTDHLMWISLDVLVFPGKWIRSSLQNTHISTVFFNFKCSCSFTMI